ncbi:uncharacterized protein UDID_17922 [Ustilago sp. UG-2017a]|nr:uncharacterized protein UDID_17922 [Ustilago sp. UG-2017a]
MSLSPVSFTRLSFLRPATVSLVADSGGIRDIDDARADFAGVCHRADSTADLGELCRSSYGLPNSTIPLRPMTPASNLTHASDLLADFHTANPTCPSPTHC